MKWWLYYQHLSIRLQYRSYFTQEIFLIGNFVNHVEQQNKINRLRDTYVVLSALVQFNSLFKPCSLNLLFYSLKHPIL